MKSFSQFLQESYLKEEEARQGSLFTRSGKPQDFRNPKKVPFVATDPTPTPASKRLPAAPPEAPKVSPGQQVIRQTSTPPTTKALPPGPRGGDLVKTSTTTLAKTPEIKSVSVRDITTKPKALPSAKPPVGKPPSGLGRFAGPASAALDTALSTADERSKGSGWARSLAKGATVAAGGLLGGTAGAIGGGGLLSAATGTAGAMAGGAAAGKAFDIAAGANARERKAMAKANRQRQAGSAIKGIGGQTTFSQNKPGGPAFMSTGVGKQRKTVELAKTGVVHRGGQSTAGHLAFKGGQAVYKAGPSAQSLAKTSSNPLERIGRSLFAGAYKQHDAMKAQQALQKARVSDASRNKALGVK